MYSFKRVLMYICPFKKCCKESFTKASHCFKHLKRDHGIPCKVKDKVSIRVECENKNSEIGHVDSPFKESVRRVTGVLWKYGKDVIFLKFSFKGNTFGFSPILLREECSNIQKIVSIVVSTRKTTSKDLCVSKKSAVKLEENVYASEKRDLQFSAFPIIISCEMKYKVVLSIDSVNFVNSHSPIVLSSSTPPIVSWSKTPEEVFGTPPWECFNYT